MGVNKFNKIKDLISIQDRVNRLFEDVIEGEGETRYSHRTWSPKVDIYETEDTFVVKAELPEVDREDIDIEVNGSILTVSGERKYHKDVNMSSFHRMEREHGHFNRSFELPSGVDEENVKADLKDGLLKIILKKRAGSEPTRIEIE